MGLNTAAFEPTGFDADPVSERHGVGCVSRREPARFDFGLEKGRCVAVELAALFAPNVNKRLDAVSVEKGREHRNEIREVLLAGLFLSLSSYLPCLEIILYAREGRYLRYAQRYVTSGVIRYT